MGSGRLAVDSALEVGDDRCEMDRTERSATGCGKLSGDWNFNGCGTSGRGDSDRVVAAGCRDGFRTQWSQLSLPGQNPDGISLHVNACAVMR